MHLHNSKCANVTFFFYISIWIDPNSRDAQEHWTLCSVLNPLSLRALLFLLMVRICTLFLYCILFLLCSYTFFLSFTPSTPPERKTPSFVQLLYCLLVASEHQNTHLPLLPLSICFKVLAVLAALLC